jgi:cysteinyl-tRNA synthetase
VSPGWHIECSAMAKKCCGDQLDIHGGGADLQFPHHENEIAQSEAASGHNYVNYWMHVAPLRVDGEKMSKSLNNFFTIRDVLAKYHPETVRFFLISSHYRSPINYSEANLIEARAGLERFYTALSNYVDVAPAELSQIADSSYYQSFVEAMNDDFNTRVALATMYDLVRELNSEKDAQRAKNLAAELKALGEILGILQLNSTEFLQFSVADQISAEAVEALIEERLQSRKDKNFARADEIRKELMEAGIVIEDAKDGTTKWRRE